MIKFTDDLSGFINFSWKFVFNKQENYLVINDKKIEIKDMLNVAKNLLFDSYLDDRSDPRLTFIKNVKNFHREGEVIKKNSKKNDLAVALVGFTVPCDDFLSILFVLLTHKKAREIPDVKSFYQIIIETTVKTIEIEESIKEQPESESMPGQKLAEPGPGVYEMSIDDFCFAMRTERCLNSLGITTARELVSFTAKQLLAAKKGFSHNVIYDIKINLRSYGLSLKKERNDTQAK